jgi:hypothetical protein
MPAACLTAALLVKIRKSAPRGQRNGPAAAGRLARTKGEGPTVTPRFLRWPRYALFTAVGLGRDPPAG